MSRPAAAQVTSRRPGALLRTMGGERARSDGTSIGAFGLEHFRLRVSGRPISRLPHAVNDVAGWAGAWTPVQPHRNWLPRSAFTLPRDKFSRYRDMPEANLIDVIEEATRRLSSDGVSVVRPLGSVAYARTDGELDWTVVRDLDTWVYVSSQTLMSQAWGELHASLQRNVHEVLVERGVFTDLSERTGYVYLRDDSCKRRLIELKLADMKWLREGLTAAAARNPTLVRPGRPAHATRPRLEWSGYVPHENHFASPAAQEPFVRTVTSMTRAEVVFAQTHTYVENLAEAMRVLGPSRLQQALSSEPKLRRYLFKVSKKQMMLGVLLREDERRRRGLERIVALRGDEIDWSRAQARRQVVAEAVEDFRLLRNVRADSLRRWVEPGRDPLDGLLAWLPGGDLAAGNECGEVPSGMQ